MLNCKICNEIVENYSKLSVHIRKNHINIGQIKDFQEYYDIYILKNEKLKYCKVCNKKNIFGSIHKGYSTYCSLKCSQLDPELNKRRYKKLVVTMTEKYGVKSSRHIEESEHKRKETMIMKYGVENPGQIESGKIRSKKTKLEKYGNENYNNNEKREKTCIERYGETSATKLTEVKQKYKETCLKKYGTEHPMQNDDIKQQMLETKKSKYGGIGYDSDIINDKIKNTLIEKYGVDSPQKNKEISEKTQNTNIERYGNKAPCISNKIAKEKYGVDRFSEVPEIIEKQKVNRKKSLNEKYNIDNISQLDSTQETIKNNNFKKYGVTSTSKLESVKDKAKKTLMKNYGVENPMHSYEIVTKVNKAFSRKQYRIQDYILPDNRIIKYQSITELNFIKYCITNNIYIENGDSIYYNFNGKQHKYFIDFKIKENDKWRLIEIKKKHKWWFDHKKSGLIKQKTIAAQLYSKQNNFLPYKIYFNF